MCSPIHWTEKTAQNVAGPSSGVPPSGAPQTRATSELIEISDDDEEDYPALDVNYHPHVSSYTAKKTKIHVDIAVEHTAY